MRMQVTRTARALAVFRGLRHDLRPMCGASGQEQSPPGFPARAQCRRRRGGSPRVAAHAPPARPPYTCMRRCREQRELLLLFAVSGAVCGLCAAHQVRNETPSAPQPMPSTGGGVAALPASPLMHPLHTPPQPRSSACQVVAPCDAVLTRLLSRQVCAVLPATAAAVPDGRRADPTGAPCGVARHDRVAASTCTEQISSLHHGEQKCSLQVPAATRS